MHHVAPAHFTRDVMQLLVFHCSDRWIARNGPVLRPPRSPNLTHADFCLWDHLKGQESTRAKRALAFDPSGCDNNKTRAWNFSAYQEFLASRGLVMNLNYRRAFSATFAKI
jgi:hypothetical protein